MIHIIRLLLVALAATQVIGSAIKGAANLEHPPTKGGSPLLEAPASKGRATVLERQQEQRIEAPASKGRAVYEQRREEQQEQQQQQRIETSQVVEVSLPTRHEPLKQEELQEEVIQVEENRASAKGGARKQESRKQQEVFELLAAGQTVERNEQKLLETKSPLLATQQKEEILEKKEEIKQQTRYEARPQIEQITEQVKLTEASPAVEQVKLVEQQRFDYNDKQEAQVELRLPQEEQRKEPHYFEAVQQQEQQIYQQREEDLQQQQQQQQVKGIGASAEAEPYSFSYAIDGSSRSESGDTKGVVRGQYSLLGADGSRRIVDYIADQDGFRASINTNEFGTEARSPASVALKSSQPSAEELTLRLEGQQQQQQLLLSKTRELPVRQQLIGGLKGSAEQTFQPQQQQTFEQHRLSGALKGSSLPETPISAPVKGLPLLQEQQEPIPAAPAAAIKRTEPAAAAAAARKEAAPQAAQQEPIRTLEESNKSAELSRREPKSLKSSESRLGQPRLFESATAHRDYKAPQRVLQQQQHYAPSRPQQVIVRQSPLLRAQQQVPYQPARQYPPSPAAANPRRYQVGPVETPRNPRVSFLYSSSSTEEDQPIGFDSRSA